MREAAWPGYFADPFLLATDEGCVAYGSDNPEVPRPGFDALRSTRLSPAGVGDWHSVGRVFGGASPELGDAYWAPEVAFADNAWWMYYSLGRGIVGHHIRVARSDSAVGPFEDVGVDLTPDESFAIDAHPFRDVDGSWYLFYARDVLDAPRPGTHLAVKRMTSMTSLEERSTAVLAPDSDWQIYERSRSMYGRVFDWHTLEGPTVVRQGSRYVLFFSGGSWEGPGYGVSFATAEHPLGPWHHEPASAADVLSSAITGVIGPGHNSILRREGQPDLIAYHAWDSTRARRQLYIEPLTWRAGVPRVGL